MSFFNIREPNKNPAAIMVSEMPTIARSWNFDVEFYISGIQEVNGVDAMKFQYFVSDVDKPKFTLKYDEINQYGFRYPILTGITYDPISMSIIDDASNKTLAFLLYYLSKSMNSTTGKPSGTRFINSEMLPVLNTNPEFATVSLPGGDVSENVVIQKIVLNQYVSVGPDGTGRGRIRSWTFHDPQITFIDMDTFSSEDDKVSAFRLSINYKNVSIALDKTDYPDSPTSSSYLDKLSPVAKEIFKYSDNKQLRSLGFDADKLMNDPWHSDTAQGRGLLRGTKAGQIVRNANKLLSTTARSLGVTKDNLIKDGLFKSTSKRYEKEKEKITKPIPGAQSQIKKLGKL